MRRIITLLFAISGFLLVTTCGPKIYIPLNLDESMRELKTILDDDVIQEIKDGSEEDLIQYHMGLGMWIRNNWELWKGSRLSKWFNAKGIYHPDDMSGIILDSFWRHLNGAPINLEKQIRFYQDFWESSKTVDSIRPGSS